MKGRLAFGRFQRSERENSANSLDMGSATYTHYEESEESSVQIVDGEDLLQIRTAEILQRLPREIMTHTLLWEKGIPVDLPQDIASTTMEYICHAVRLFVSLCPKIRSMGPSLEQFDAEYELHLIDTMCLLLSAMASGKTKLMDAIKEMEDTDLIRDAAASMEVAPSCLRSILLYFTEKGRGVRKAALNYDDNIFDPYEEMDLDYIVVGLTSHPRGCMFLQAALESTTVTLNMLGEKLRHDGYTTLVASRNIAGSVEYLLRLIEVLFSNEWIYEWYLEHEPNGASMLRLVCSSLDLVTNGLSSPPFFSVMESNQYTFEARQRQGNGNFYPTDSCQGYAEFIGARACAIIASLAYQPASLLDLLPCDDPETKRLVDHMMQNVVYILKQVLTRPSIDSHDPSPGEGQLMINCLRAANILCSHENFKELATKAVHEDIMYLLCNMAPKAFRSFWGTGPMSIQYMAFDTLLVDSSSREMGKMNDTYFSALLGERKLKFVDVSFRYEEWVNVIGLPNFMMGFRYALERSVLLIKLIFNLQKDITYDEPVFVRDRFTLTQSDAMECLERNVEYLYIFGCNCLEGDLPQVSEAEILYLNEMLEKVSEKRAE